METTTPTQLYIKPRITIVYVDVEKGIAGSLIKQDDAETVGGFHIGRDFPHFPGSKHQD